MFLMIRIAMFCGFCALTGIVSAEVFHYVTDSGRKVYVSSLHKVPAEYRGQLKVKAEASASLTTEQKTAQNETRADAQIQADIRREIRRIEGLRDKMRTPVIIRGNQVVVPVRMITAGRRLDLKLILDTGATRTVIHQQAVQGVSLNVREKGKATVAGGGVISMQYAIFERIEFGPYTFKNHTAAIIESKGQSFSDGLLGMDLLASSAYKIDFNEQVIIWNAEQYQKATDLIAELMEAQQPDQAVDK